MKNIIFALLAFPVMGSAGIDAIDNSINFVSGDARYVNVAGDTMTGTLNGTEQRLSGQLIVGGSVTVTGKTTLTGNVGIGTANQDRPLVVNSAGDTWVGLRNGDTEKFAIGSIGSPDRFTIYGSAYYLMIDRTSGNVGINQTVPVGQFNIKSKSGPNEFIVSVSSQNDISGGIFNIQGNGSSAFVGSVTASSFTATGDIVSTCYVAKYTNADNVAHSSGTLVQIIRGTGLTTHISTTAAGDLDTIGAIQDVSCAAGAICSVGIGGTCSVLLDSGESCPSSDNIILTGTELGRAACDTTATIPDHFTEIGHPLDVPAGAGQVIKAVLHFN